MGVTAPLPTPRPPQVNLASAIYNKLVQDIAACSESVPPPADLFDEASTDIFTLMEKDTFARFKRDPKALQSLLDRYHTAAGGGSTVSWKAFRAWAIREPTVMVLFTGLSSSIRE